MITKLIVFGAGVYVGYKWAESKLRRGGAGAAGGLAGVNTGRHEAKETAKARVMDLFVSREEVSNDDVESALGVSDSTATIYLEELVEAGKLSRVGDTGRSVKYRKS